MDTENSATVINLNGNSDLSSLKRKLIINLKNNKRKKFGKRKIIKNNKLMT